VAVYFFRRWFSQVRLRARLMMRNLRSACEFLPACWLIAKNIKLYFLFYVNEINIFSKILLIAKNSSLEITFKKGLCIIVLDGGKMMKQIQWLLIMVIIIKTVRKLCLFIFIF